MYTVCIEIQLHYVAFSLGLCLYSQYRNNGGNDIVLICHASFVHCRSIGVANFNAHHLRELKTARPDDVPVGRYIQCSILINISILYMAHSQRTRLRSTPSWPGMSVSPTARKKGLPSWPTHLWPRLRSWITPL